MEARLVSPQWLSPVCFDRHFMSASALTEDDIPGSSLAGREPASLKIEELRFWLRCRGDSLKGLKTKSLLVKR